MIWSTRRDVDFFEPGANSRYIAVYLKQELEKEYKEYFQREGPGSRSGRILKSRYNFMSIIVDRMMERKLPYWTWWGEQRPSEGTATMGDLTSGRGDAGTLQTNITSISPRPNITVLDFSIDNTTADEQ